jgi:hypothetical protein
MSCKLLSWEHPSRDYEEVSEQREQAMKDLYEAFARWLCRSRGSGSGLNATTPFYEAATNRGRRVTCAHPTADLRTFTVSWIEPGVPLCPKGVSKWVVCPSAVRFRGRLLLLARIITSRISAQPEFRYGVPASRGLRGIPAFGFLPLHPQKQTHTV